MKRVRNNKQTLRSTICDNCFSNKTPQVAAISAQLVTEKQLCRPKRLWTFYLTWVIEANNEILGKNEICMISFSVFSHYAVVHSKVHSGIC